MKPWQAWTVTICAVLICIVQLYQGLFLFTFNYQMGEMMEGSEKAKQKADKDWDAAMEEMRKDRDRSWLPEKPKGRATLNPPR